VKAWQFTKVGEPLSLRDVAVPQPGTGQVLIDVKASGLCHSDVGYLDGTIPHLPFAPITLGTR
jgi:alcohol dehydrogenase, propanol-preferring